MGTIAFGRPDNRRRPEVGVPHHACGGIKTADLVWDSTKDRVRKALQPPDHFGSSALIAGPNSAIGSAASHMRSKWTSNLAAAPLSRITIKSLSCARSPLVLKFADPVRSISPSTE